MSVILYEPKKFGQVASSLKFLAGNPNKSHLLMPLLPKDWTYRQKYEFLRGERRQLEALIVEFAGDLHRSNVSAWNNNYGETEPVETAAPCGLPLSLIELCKSLHSIRYNLIENDGRENNFRGALEKLQELLNALHEDIVIGLPQYDAAKTWN